MREEGNVIMLSNNKHPIYGILSLVLGVFNLMISFIIYWALWSYTHLEFSETLPLQFAILNYGDIYELIFEPLGLLLGLMGLFQKNRKRNVSIIGITINVVVILWSLAIHKGLFL